MPEVCKCIEDNDIVLRQKGLRVLYLIISLHDPQYIRPEVKSLSGVISKVAERGDCNVRVKSQALMIIAQLLVAIRNVNKSMDYDKSMEGVVMQLFTASLKTLEINDVEMEV